MPGVPGRDAEEATRAVHNQCMPITFTALIGQLGEHDTAPEDWPLPRGQTSSMWGTRCMGTKLVEPLFTLLCSDGGFGSTGLPLPFRAHAFLQAALEGQSTQAAV